MRGALSAPIRCPRGHHGPFRYVEAIEVWRNVVESSATSLRIHGLWQTGDGYWERQDGSEYLECHYDYCLLSFPLPSGIQIDWV